MLDHRLKSGPLLTWKELLNLGLTQYGMQVTLMFVAIIVHIKCYV